MIMEELNESNFYEKIRDADFAVVDFWAAWCPPCRALAPIFERVADKNKNVKFFKVDVDANSSLANKFGVRGIPTIILFADGKEVDRIVGLVSEEILNSKVISLVINR